MSHQDNPTSTWNMGEMVYLPQNMMNDVSFIDEQGLVNHENDSRLAVISGHDDQNSLPPMHTLYYVLPFFNDTSANESWEEEVQLGAEEYVLMNIDDLECGTNQSDLPEAENSGSQFTQPDNAQTQEEGRSETEENVDDLECGTNHL